MTENRLTAAELRRNWLKEASISPITIQSPEHCDQMRERLQSMGVTHIDGIPIVEADLRGRYWLFFANGEWYVERVCDSVP